MQGISLRWPIEILIGILTYDSIVRVAVYSRRFRKFMYSLTNVNRLTPNDPYMGRTAPLTSKTCIFIFIQQI